MKACNTMENKLIAYLYGELTEAERKEVEAHLRECPACREAYQELKNTREILAQYEVQTNSRILPMSGRISSSKPVISIGGILKYSIAAAILLLFLTRFSMEYGNGNFSIRFGGAPFEKTARYVTQDDLFKQNESQIALFKQMLEAQNQIQDARMLNYMNQYTSALQDQREKDFITMFNSVSSMVQQTRSDLVQTHQAVLGLYQNAGKPFRAE